MSVQGKIIKSIAGFYDVYAEDTLYRCRAKGVFRSLGEKPLVGDDVLIDVTDTVSDPKEGNVVRLLPRRNDLIRPNVANVDLLFAITNPAPSYNMLDRFLILMKQKRLPAILCFNKLDLATAEQLAELKSVYEKCGCRVMFIQTTDEESLSPLIVALSGKTTVITGPSGAGKSSLINRLCPAAHMQTGELSRKISRGKNTTRHTELLAAGGGTYRGLRRSICRGLRQTISRTIILSLPKKQRGAAFRDAVILRSRGAGSRKLSARAGSAVSVTITIWKFMVS